MSYKYIHRTKCWNNISELYFPSVKYLLFPMKDNLKMLLLFSCLDNTYYSNSIVINCVIKAEFIEVLYFVCKSVNIIYG